MLKEKCQIQGLEKMALPLGGARALWQRRNRLRRILKRRGGYLLNMLSERGVSGEDKTPGGNGGREAEPLKPGDVVLVRPREEIKETLDWWSRLKGCSLMEEMWPYCGTTQRVLKRVERFLDERDYLMKKCRGLVILDGVFCEGTGDFGLCDRTCFFFWREEWLEKIN